MPTLLAINNYYYRRGGAEVIFLEQNRLFEKVGWDVPVFCMRHPDNLDTPWARFFVNEVEFGRPYPALEKIVLGLKAVYSFEARSKLRQLLKEVQPDIAHCHNIYHHISPAILTVLKRYQIPTVITLHDLKLACPAYTMLAGDGPCERCKNGMLHNVLVHRCMKESLALSGLVMFETLVHRVLGSYARNVDRFVVPSRFYLDKFVEWGWDSNRFVHIPNFVDLAAFEPQYSRGDYFLYFGRLSREKGITTLVKAAALAGVRLFIAGTGPQEPELRRLAEECGACVKFLGYLSGEDLHDALRGALATVLPSQWYENAPISIMESYACGKPVIGTAFGGIPELIRERETGVIFPLGSVEGLAEALSFFHNLPHRQMVEMGKAGRAWMEADYSAERYRERTLQLYMDLGVAL